MQDAQTITVTVKVPFVGDRTLTTNTLVTVKDLTDNVLATCQTPSLHQSPQCIVQRGRILSETSTLQQAGVSNGAVLHLMPRPRDSRIPGRARSTRPRSRSDRTDTPNSGDVSDAPSDDDRDDTDHHHEHEGEHHIHANVIIGHVAVDGRIQYSDAHDMLLSVLHAVGFSTRAVRAAAAVAAAVATAMQSSEERAAASRTVLQTAWEGTRNLQERLSRDTTATASDGDRRSLETQNESPVEVTPAISMETQSGVNESSSRVEESAGEAEQSRKADANDMPEHTATVTQESPTDTRSSVSQGAGETHPLLPENPPAIEDGETVLQASERAADGLLPVVGDLMETMVSRIRNAPSMINLEGSDRLGVIQRLTEDLGSMAGVVTIVTTLISTLLPDSEDLRTTNSRNDGAQGPGTHRQDATGARGDVGSNSSAPRETNNASSRVGQRQGQTGNRGSNHASRGTRTQSGSNGDNGSRTGRQPSFSLFPFGPSSERNQGTSRSNRRVRRSRRVRVSSSQAANADFMIRVLSYYFCSLSDIQLPEGSGPPDCQGQTAVSVLDSLYGRNDTARPVNILLRIVHTAMQKLSPRQFHEILRGNMEPLGRIRHELWEEISQQLRASHIGAIEREDVEEVFVDHICEVLHEFVHILESADEANEDGVFTPGPEDFCHHIMHIIQGKMEKLARILAGRDSVQEFAEKMSLWIGDAVGEILFAISSELEMQWDGLLISFRRAVYEIGKTVVGSQFSVIFPYLANLLANRAKEAYQRSAARHPEARPSTERAPGCVDTNGEEDHANCGPGCESCMMLDEDSASHDDSDLDLDGESYNETESDMPDLEEAETDDNSQINSDDEMSDTNGEGGDSVSGDISQREPNRIIRDLHLQDAELHDLANELEAEATSKETRSAPEVALDENDLKDMASELAAELDASLQKTGPASFHSRSLGTPVEKKTYARGSNMNSILSTSGSIPSSSTRHAKFSSAAVRRGSGSSTTVTTNDFEKVLGSSAGERWKRVVDHDQVRVRERSYGPLSRGYSGAKSNVPTLDTTRGAELATEAAREAAQQAKLSPERARELERVASESGSQFMNEIERAIGSRLLSDPDFDKQSFPRAAKRFLPDESAT